MTHEAKGTIKCSLKKQDSDQDWWMVLDNIDEEIGQYHRHLWWLEHNKGKKLSRPYWGTHVTIIRNEIPPNINKWWNFHQEEIVFQYFPGVMDNYGPERYRSFYWLDVFCPKFDKIRQELGLHPNPDRIYHMTIGSIENEANRDIYKRIWK